MTQGPTRLPSKGYSCLETLRRHADFLFQRSHILVHVESDVIMNDLRDVLYDFEPCRALVDANVRSSFSRTTKRKASDNGSEIVTWHLGAQKISTCVASTMCTSVYSVFRSLFERITRVCNRTCVAGKG